MLYWDDVWSVHYANEIFVLNKPKESSSPVKNLFTEKRALLTVMIWLTYGMSPYALWVEYMVA